MSSYKCYRCTLLSASHPDMIRPCLPEDHVRVPTSLLRIQPPAGQGCAERKTPPGSLCVSFTDDAGKPMINPRLFASGEDLIANKKNRSVAFSDANKNLGVKALQGDTTSLVYEVTESLAAAWTSSRVQSQERRDAGKRMLLVLGLSREAAKRQQLFEYWRDNRTCPTVSAADAIRDLISELDDEGRALLKADMCDMFGLQPGAQTIGRELDNSITRVNARVGTFLQLVRDVFGGSDVDASLLHEARTNNKRFKTADSLVPARKKSQPEVLTLLYPGDPGVMWYDELETTNSKNDSVVKRIGHIWRELETREDLRAKCDSIRSRMASDQVAGLFGVGRPVLKNGSAPWLELMYFLRYGFFPAAIHLSRVTRQGAREAILTSRTSLFAAARYRIKSQRIPADQKQEAMMELEHLATVWGKLFDFSEQTAVCQERVHRDIPQTDSLWCIAVELDRIVASALQERSKQSGGVWFGLSQTVFARAFLGLAICAGLRSENMARLRTSSWKPAKYEHYVALNRNTMGKLVLVMTSNKRDKGKNSKETTCHTVPLPEFVDRWVTEYEQGHRQVLLDGKADHQYMFFTPTGLPLKEEDTAGNSAALATKHKAENGTVIQLIRRLCDVLLGNKDMLGEVTCFTDLRSMSLAHDVEKGSLLWLLQKSAAHAGKPAEPDLNHSMWQSDMKCIAELNKSSKEQADGSYIRRKVGLIKKLSSKMGDVFNYVDATHTRVPEPDFRVLRHKIVRSVAGKRKTAE